MKKILLSVATRCGLAACSIALGMVAYLIVLHFGSVRKLEAAVTEPINPIVLQQPTVLDAEAHLIAQTESPVDLDSDALGISYILQRDGQIIRVAPEAGGGTRATPYASLANFETDPVLGFASLAIHPDFLVKGRPGYGRFYIISSEKSGAGEVDFTPEFGGSSEHHQDVLHEYVVDDPLLMTFRGKRREILRFRQPGSENNLNGLAFDPSGCLYFGVGDGAAAEVGRRSPSCNASSLTSAYGKVLRIDPTGTNSANGAYGIPEDNPFRLVSGALPELWVFGLRAPHSLSFDPFRNSLCIGESGHRGREEINFSNLGGEHFGWDLAEGSAKMDFATKARLAEIVTPPAITLDLNSGFSARTTGSMIYRG